MRSWTVFRKSDPQQGLFGVATQLSESARRRLKGSWAEGFRQEVLPGLFEVEPGFARLYGETGRPNFSVARVLGICILQEMNGLSDQSALDSFCFDVRWQHALDVTGEEAYLSRRSLVEFRRRLVNQDPDMTLMREAFERLGEKAIKGLGLSTKEQRLDSTLVISNVRVAGLLELFRATTRQFLGGLNQQRWTRIPGKIRRWYERSGDGWFGLGAAERRDKLDELLPFVKQLIELFARDEEVASTEAYQLLMRVFDEHCEVKPGKKPPSGYGQPKKRRKGKRRKRRGATTRVRDEIVLKHKKGATLQSPFDPGVEYGHKGAGYHVHVTETCNNPGKPEIITDYEVHGAARSDIGKAVDVLDRLEKAERRPDTLYADAGYPTPESLVGLRKRGTELYAPVHRGPMKDEVMGRDRFRFDSDGYVHRCPRGCKPIDHRIQNPNGEGVHLHAYFNGDKCRRCPKLEICPVRAPNHRAKGTDVRDTVGNFRLDISPELRARDERLAEQNQRAWKDQYRIRSGVEATISELKRAHGMGRLRVRRLPRVHVAVVCKAIACNVKRWLRALLAAILACLTPLCRPQTLTLPRLRLAVPDISR